VQFFGPLTQHGGAFLPDFYKNDLTGFVTPSGYLLFHTAASAAAAARYQGGPSEYLGYLGWPLIAVLAVATVAGWRRPAVRATAVTLAVMELLSVGGHPLISGTVHTGITLPWRWLENVPLLGAALPDRMSIVADGAAAALLAFALDRAWARRGQRPDPRPDQLDRRPAEPDPRPDQPGAPPPWRPARARWVAAVATFCAVGAFLSLIPRPLPAVAASPVPAGWSAAFAALRLPPGARVLVVPVPTATLTNALRWQADTGQPGSMAGGYFIGPAWNGQAYVDGDGVAATAQYLDGLWTGQAVPVPSRAQVQADLRAWRPAAVVAVTSPNSALGHYLEGWFGRPTIRAGSVLAWRA
jgi:hypothetical protein